MHYLANFSTKKKKNIKTHYRRNKDGSISTVRTHLRNVLAGGALLGTGFLLGKRFTKPKVIEKIVSREIPVNKEVIREVEKIVTKEVPITKEVIREVVKTISVPQKVAPRLARVKRKVFLSGTLGIKEFPTSEIEFDPKRFQYKLLGKQNSKGVVGSLTPVRKYDHRLGGVIQVWKDPKDAKVYVVNGHNRLAKAKELEEKNIAVMFIKAQTSKQAKAVGALTNIAEGQGTALDAGDFFREHLAVIKGMKNYTGKPRLITKQTDLDATDIKKTLREMGLNTDSKRVEEGIALTKLDDNLFNLAKRGELKENIALTIARSGLSKEKQAVFYKQYLSKNKNKLTLSQLEELLEQLQYSKTTASEVDQLNLFGNNQILTDTFVTKAKLVNGFKQELEGERAFKAYVARKKNQRRLENMNAKLDQKFLKDTKEDLESKLAWFNLHKFDPEINSVIEKYAQLVQKETMKEKQALEEMVDQILDIIDKQRLKAGVKNKNPYR